MPLRCAVIWSVVLVGGGVGAGVAVEAGVALGVGAGEGLAAAALFVTFAEQMTRAPPPLAEPLH